MTQLPVRLPVREVLAAAAGRSKVVGQFRTLAEWLGPEGRELTAAKNIRPADARELITLLGTGDEGLKFRSAAELPGLSLVVGWAQQARVIRRQGSRLLPVAKARPLLADAEALWQRAFEAAFAIDDAVCRPTWADEPPSPAQQTYDVVVPDLLATLAVLRERARSLGQSLLGYLRDLMDAYATAETNAEVIARIARDMEPVDLTMDDILAAR